MGRRIYSIHVKEHKDHTECGMATVHLDDLIVWMWGKNSADYVFVLEDIVYDMDCDGNVEEKIRGIVDFDAAFYSAL